MFHLLRYYLRDRIYLPRGRICSKPPVLCAFPHSVAMVPGSPQRHVRGVTGATPQGKGEARLEMTGHVEGEHLRPDCTPFFRTALSVGLGRTPPSHPASEQSEGRTPPIDAQ